MELTDKEDVLKSCFILDPRYVGADSIINNLIINGFCLIPKYSKTDLIDFGGMNCFISYTEVENNDTLLTINFDREQAYFSKSFKIALDKRIAMIENEINYSKEKIKTMTTVLKSLKDIL